MSSSPRLIVLLACAFFFIGAFFSHAYASELTLQKSFHLEGLTFYQSLTFSHTLSHAATISFDMTPTFTLNNLPGEEVSIEAVITPAEPELNVLAASTSNMSSITETPTPTLEPTETPTPTLTPPLPTATPTPPPAIVSPVDLESLFTRFSDEYHVDKELLKRIASCESSFNSGASYMDYGGMFQFSSSSWSSTRGSMGQDTNPELRYNAEESIKTAAFKISRDGSSAWPSCD